MDLVGYGSSDEESGDESVEKQPLALSPTPLSTQQNPPPSTPAVTVTTDGSTSEMGKGKLTANETNDNNDRNKRRPEDTHYANKGSKKHKSRKHGKRKHRKVVKALVLSPEIHAALARGVTLGDSDSDDPSGEKNPAKSSVKRSAGDPNDLLSLLPPPSTASSVDDILLKCQQKRREAATAKTVATTSAAYTTKSQGAAPVATSSIEVRAASGRTGTAGAAAIPKPAETSTGVEASKGESNSEGDGGDSGAEDDDDHDLLSNLRSKSSLFTLPSRSKTNPPAPVANLFPPAHTVEVGRDAPFPASLAPTDEAGDHLSSGSGVAVGVGAGAERVDLAQGQEWAWQGQAGAWHEGGGAVYGGESVETGRGLQQQQVQSSGLHPSGYGGFQPQQSSHHAGAHLTGALAWHQSVVPVAGAVSMSDFHGGAGGAKASRRRGRDMERALAGGDLGAIENETVMDLHQGINDFNPLRAKPLTAAMQHEKKHIEGSVYDPSTGKTVKTLEPTSTQKRKHQINQLAVQAASMERDLMERSGASRLTKAQTHAKYGW